MLSSLETIGGRNVSMHADFRWRKVDVTRHFHGCRVVCKRSSVTVNKRTHVSARTHLLLEAINEIRFLYRSVSVVTRVRLAYRAVETSYPPNCERLHTGRPLHDCPYIRKLREHPKNMAQKQWEHRHLSHFISFRPDKLSEI